MNRPQLQAATPAQAPAGAQAYQAAPPPLLSAQWFRVAPLRPQLHAQVRDERLVLRGQVWHALVGADGRRGFRLNAAAWGAVARCNGQHTVQQLWQASLAHSGDDAPTQDELLVILARLHAASLLSFDRRPDFGDDPSGAAPAQAAWAALAAQTAQTAQTAQAAADETPAHRRQHLLAWRISLGSPDRALARLAALLHQLPGPGSGAWLTAWLLVLAWAALAGLPQAPELSARLGALLGSAHSWGLVWLAYPVMKVLHEAAHGLAARRCGAVVSEWGISFLMFVPVPYVDASAASALPLRRQRLAVSAAGIVAESGIAVAALAVSLNVAPGALNDGALLVFFMAALSTLLVNANPLLRFDGYHMLCDACGLPNLATRSAQHWLHQLRRHLLRSQAAGGVQAAPGEAPWLWAYAPAALAMRWLVAGAVIVWLGGAAQLLGQLAIAAFAWMLVIAPLLALLSWLRRSGWQQLRSAGANSRLGRRVGLVWPLALLTAPLALCMALLLWPLPVSSVAQGVLWLPESALVRAQASGFVDQVLVTDGQTVQPGDTVMTLHAPALQAEAERLQGRVLGLQAEQERALRDDPAAAAVAEHALQAAQAELAQNQQRIGRLKVLAQAAGRIVIEHAADLPGRHVQRGALLAHVLTGEAGIVRLAIPHDQGARWPTQATPVQVLPADDTGAPRSGLWLGAPSGGQTQLPSAALGSRSGGRISTEIINNSGDASGLRPAQAVLLGEVRLEGAAATRIGQRVLVRFEHGQAPLLLQAARAAQQLLLHHFNPAP